MPTERLNLRLRIHAHDAGQGFDCTQHSIRKAPHCDHEMSFARLRVIYGHRFEAGEGLGPDAPKRFQRQLFRQGDFDRDCTHELSIVALGQRYEGGVRVDDSVAEIG